MFVTHDAKIYATIKGQKKLRKEVNNAEEEITKLQVAQVVTDIRHRKLNLKALADAETAELETAVQEANIVTGETFTEAQWENWYLNHLPPPA